jgi:hypothetical protein
MILTYVLTVNKCDAGILNPTLKVTFEIQQHTRSAGDAIFHQCCVYEIHH